MAKIPINIKEGTVRKDSTDLIVGIDLGTTNSLIAYIENGSATAISATNSADALVPSVVHFSPDGNVLIGKEAMPYLLTDPSNTIYSVKRLMGKSYSDLEDHKEFLGYEIIDEDEDKLVKIRVRDKFYTPIELSAKILSELKSRAEDILGKKVSRAVITVPAYFNDTQRQATRDAGKLAGLDVLRIINEPTAASLAYGVGIDQQERSIIAVYDLGGGTFDISILSIHDGIFEVLSTNGDTFLGGDDFDKAILEHWQQTNNIDSDQFSQDPTLRQKLRLEAEKAKRELSFSEEYIGQLQNLNCSLKRKEFESLIQPLIKRTLIACERALKDSGKTSAEIDKVIMVGGSTRVPAVKKAVSDLFEQEVYDDLNPDEVVALGAAIQADVLAGNNKDLLLIDVTPLSLGIETIGGLMDVIIPRNTKVPTKAGRQYTTSVDGQVKLRIGIYQGERDLIADNRKLGEFILSGIPPMPAGLPKIEIQFILNADGILVVKASELRSGVEQSIEVKSQYGISEEEMAQMLLESLKHAEADMATRSLLEARNEASNIILSSEKFIQQNQDILTAEEIETIKILTSKLRTACEGSDKDKINGAMDDLNKYSTPLAQTAMEKTIKEAIKGKKL